MKKALISVALLSVLTACTWVKVSEDGGRVAVTNSTNVTSCEKLREVTVKVTAAVGPVNRSGDKVAVELANLARNEAVGYGGDTVAALGPVRNGAQDFGVYRCK